MAVENISKKSLWFKHVVKIHCITVVNGNLVAHTYIRRQGLSLTWVNNTSAIVLGIAIGSYA